MPTKNLVYDLNDRPKFSKLIIYSFQMLLAILAATIAVPTIIGLPAQIPAAILGAGVGTLVYVLFTKGKSPVMLSSSFAFLNSLVTATAFGYMGIALGGLFAGTVYVIIAIVIHFVGTNWVNKLMPAVIIGPVVALIGLSLAVNAMRDMQTISEGQKVFTYQTLISTLCGLITFFVVAICSIQNKKKGIKLIPFIIGILAGYAVASIFTVIGKSTNNANLILIDWSPITKNYNPLSWKSFISVPKVSLVEAIKEIAEGRSKLTGAGVATVALAFIPVAFVTFAEHLADHKNISSIINRDLINKEPGLSRTLMGDGVGSIAGTFFGICPNTTYGESIACVAMSKNASVITTITTAIMCILLSFIAPFNTVLQTIPRCVMGGVCLALYGYIAVSGLKMFKEVNLDDNVNLLTVCSVLIAGIGGLAIRIPYEIASDGTMTKTIEIGSIACALILGIATYQIGLKLSGKSKSKVHELNVAVKEEDNFRSYLKTLPVDTLAKGLLTFGFIHENVDFTAAQLSNFLRSKRMLETCSDKELRSLVKLFNFDKDPSRLGKNKCIEIISKNIIRLDKMPRANIVAQEIR